MKIIDSETDLLLRHILTAVPKDRRAPAKLILLLAQYLAEIYPSVSDATIGQMRLTWWHEQLMDACENHAQSDSKQSVTTALPAVHLELLQAITSYSAQYRLSPCFFAGMVEGRMLEFTATPFNDWQDFYRYAQNLYGNLFCLWAQIICHQDGHHSQLPDDTDRFWQILRQATEIYAVNRIVRFIYWQSQPSNPNHQNHQGVQIGGHNTQRNGMLFLPQIILQKHGLDATMPVTALKSPHMKLILKQVITDAQQRHSDALAELASDSKMRQYCALMPSLFKFSAFANNCLQHFAKHDYDYLRPRAIATPVSLPLKLRLKKRIF